MPDDMPEPPENETRTLKRQRARLRRREKIQRRADAAVARWHERMGLPAGADPATYPLGETLRPLPRPPGLGLPRKEGGSQSGLPERPREVQFKASAMRTAWRLVVWLYGGLLFALGVAWDWLNRRNSRESRARRLRQAFERMGTTFIKIGQQLSMRLDILPYEYTHELEQMLDRVPAFPATEAVRTIERASGRPLAETFAAFDSEPIGSASVACVYQAVLLSGERVAVKVRRPGIGPRLAADMRALGWLLAATEVVFLTPGFTTNLAYELRTMLMEELDFVREARFADLYRQRTRKTPRLRFVTAPRVYFECSSDEVLVTEHVSGVWMGELLQALESEDAAALARLERLNIDRHILARRIQLMARFNNFEHLFFHADLHPANILVQPGNKIVLIDFGSCGSFDKSELNSWRRWFDAQSIDDVGGMVQAALGILEPLPLIDRDAFGQRLQSEFWSDLYAIKSKHSHWSERISSRLWLGFLRLSREFQIPMRLNTLRMIRASMLSDTIAARLDHGQDPYREFRYYEKAAGRRARKRLHKRVRRLLGPGKYIRLEQALESALKLGYMAQRVADSLSSIRVGAFVSKVAYFTTLLLRHVTWIVLSATVPTVALWVRYNYVQHAGPVSLREILVGEVMASNAWWFAVLFPSLMVLWRISFRLHEREQPHGNRGLGL